MLKIIRKEKSRIYELTDGHQILGLLSYQTSQFEKLYIHFSTGEYIHAQISIEKDIYSIKQISKFGDLSVPENGSIELLDQSQKILSKIDFYRRAFPFQSITLSFGDKKYHINRRSKLLQIFAVPSSSIGWFDKEGKEVMYLTTKGFAVLKEVTVETQLDQNDHNTKLMALWAFYFLPKPRSPIWAFLIIFVLCPFLLYILYETFLPYFMN